MTGGMTCPPVEEAATTAPAKLGVYPAFFIRGMVKAPVVTALATELPDTVPCKALEPFVQEMHQKYGDKMAFAGLNTTKARRLAISQKVLGLPVMAIYQNGEKVEELVKDDCTHENIEAMIKRYL